MVDAHSATAADFDSAAQRHANAFWRWLLLAAIVWWFASIWWALIPGAVAALKAYLSVGSTLAAKELRTGKYKVWNPNNGAPDGQVGTSQELDWQPLDAKQQEKRNRDLERIERLNREWDEVSPELEGKKGG